MSKRFYEGGGGFVDLDGFDEEAYWESYKRKHPPKRSTVKKQRLCTIGGEFGYMFYINNDQLLTWARNDRIRAYLSNDPETRDDNLRKDMRYFIEAINAWPMMAEYNLGLFKEDEDQLYADFKEMIAEEVELGSLGILEPAVS